MPLKLSEEKIIELMSKCYIIALQGRRSGISRPYVGCLVLSPDSEIISSGFRTLEKYRRTIHAERSALQNVRAREGDTLVTTLEPCVRISDHQIKVSCSELIVEKGIEQVVIGAYDNSPSVNNHAGARYLKDHGVKVVYSNALQTQIKNDLDCSTEPRIHTISLEDVLREDKLIIIDSLDALNPFSYLENANLLSLTDNSLKSDGKELNRIYDRLNLLFTKYLEVIQSHRVFITPDVVERLKTYESIFRHKVNMNMVHDDIDYDDDDCNHKKYCRRKNSLRKKGRYRSDKGKREFKRNDEDIKLIKELHQKLIDGLVLSEEKIFNPSSDPDYNLSVDLSRTILRHTYTYKDVDPTKVGLFVYWSIKPENKVSFITSDPLLVKSMIHTARNLELEDFSDYNRTFRESLEQGNFIVYKKVKRPDLNLTYSKTFENNDAFKTYASFHIRPNLLLGILRVWGSYKSTLQQ